MSQSTAASHSGNSANPRHSGNATTPRHSGKCGAFIRNPRAPFVSLIAALFLSIALPAQAATITVDTTDDVVADNEQCSLREAIDNANNNAATHDDCVAGDAGADTIEFDAALAGGTITLSSQEGVPSVQLNITEVLAITGPVAGDPASLILDGDSSFRIFKIEGDSASEFEVTLANLTLTNAIGAGAGGAVHAHNADLNLEDVLVTGNRGSSGTFGGGLHVSSGNLTLEDTIVSNNFTQGPQAHGGGIHVFNGNATLTNSSVTGNSTSGDDAFGGGLVIRNGDVTLINSTVCGNSTLGDSAFGGGLYVQNGNATLNDSTVSDNSTAGDLAGGGGLFVQSGNAVLTGSTISGNSTTGLDASGGGLFVTSGNAMFENSTVANNSTAGDFGLGGGLFINNSDATLTASTISGNWTEGQSALGGGLYVNNGNTTLNNSTVSGNSTVSNGGGLFVAGGDTILRHSTIAFNTAPDHFTGGVWTSPLHDFLLENTLIVQAVAGEVACEKQADSAVTSLATDDSCTGFATDLADINLGPLAFNGGPTQTHALLEGSVAIDAAHDLECGSLSPLEDQRGVPRPASALGCDIGAYEVATEFDMGDAPDADPQDPGATPPASYPTLFANNGAAHVPVNGPILGALIDYETDGQPTADADGDDTNDLADEDGVFFTSDIEPGMDATVDVTVTNGPALLNAWIDFNADGDWNDAGEQIFTDEPLVDGSNPGLVFPVPEEVISGETFARFRLSTVAGLTPEGIAVDGEVEDYKVAIADPTVMFNSKRDNPKVRENKGTFIVQGAVLLSNPSSQEVTVDIVYDAGASEAEIPSDFDFSPTTVTFAPGETSADVEITIVDDGVKEDDEIAVFNLANPVNATLGSPSTFQATLKDPKKKSGDDDDGGFPGCAMGPVAGPLDPLLPLVVLLAAAYLVRRLR